MKPIHILVVGAVLIVAALFWINRSGESKRGGGRTAPTQTDQERSDATDRDAERPDEKPSGLALTVKLETPEGAPAVAALVRLDGPRSYDAESGDEGAVGMTGLKAGYYNLTARLGRAVGAIGFDLEETRDLGVLRLKKAAFIRGHVYAGSRSDPLAAATVEAVVSEQAGFNMTRLMEMMTMPEGVVAHAKTGPDGAYELAVPVSGSIALRARAPGYGQETEGRRVYATDAEGLDFYLFPGSEVVGRVLGDGDAPVAGARVMVVNAMDLFTSGAPKQETVTDGTGGFAVVYAHSAQTSLVVRAPGYAVTFHQVQNPGEEIVVHLKRGLTARLRVVDPERGNAPVPGVEAMLMYKGGFGGGTTDEKGELLIQRLPQEGRSVFGGQTQAFLWGGGYVATMHKITATPEDGLLDIGTVEMKRGGVVKGKVIDVVTGDPVADARVMSMGGMNPELAMLGGARAQSKEDGTFELTGVPMAAAKVLATHPDYVVNLNMMELGMAMQGGKSIFPEGSKETTAVVKLTPAATIRGVVLDPGGTPVAGAIIRVTDQMAMMVNMFTGAGATMVTTDAEGRFEMRGAKKGEGVSIVATHRDFGASRTVSAKGSEEITLELAAPVMLKGKVIDGDGNGLGGVKVTAERKKQRGQRMGPMGDSVGARKSVTLDDGTFSVRNVATGAMQVTLDHPKFKPGKKEIAIAPGTPQHDVGTITMDRGAAIRGRLLDASGDVVEGISVQLIWDWQQNRNNPGAMQADESETGRNWGSATSDKEGKFVVYGLREGRYQVRLGGNWLPQGEAYLTPGATEHVVKLQKAASFHGVVLGTDGPQTAVQVRAQLDGNEYYASATSDGAGAFKLDQLPPDRPFTLIFRHDGYAELKADGVMVSESGREFQLDRGLRIAGEVVDPDGVAVSG
ncbi:MAG: carboxypeptidase-like regulatory domain-containing protein, partial [Planctomycetota bacterium]|nr:carboxypeptidase-like regulatory domain-containing protein [Planctomycetota bacterium]